MANRPETIADIEATLAGCGDYRTRPMFGGCTLYKDDKVVALIDDDLLFVKLTSASEPYLAAGELAPPYPGAKDHLCLQRDRWSNKEWLNELLTATADALPAPKPKRKK